jgi:hypothetical protein
LVHPSEVNWVAESRAAVSSASSCRWVKPRVGDSGGTFGRRRSRPASAPAHRRSRRCGRSRQRHIRRDTVDSYKSACGRWAAAIGSSSRSAHQAKYARRSSRCKPGKRPCTGPGTRDREAQNCHPHTLHPRLRSHQRTKIESRQIRTSGSRHDRMLTRIADSARR